MSERHMNTENAEPSKCVGVYEAKTTPTNENPRNQWAGEKRERRTENAIDSFPIIRARATSTGWGSRMTEKSRAGWITTGGSYDSACERVPMASPEQGRG